MVRYLSFVLVICAFISVISAAKLHRPSQIRGTKLEAKYYFRDRNNANMLDRHTITQPEALFATVLHQFNTEIKNSSRRHYEPYMGQYESCSEYSTYKSPAQQLCTYMANVQLTVDKSCTGVFLSPMHILINKNCVTGSKPSTISVGAGTIEGGNHDDCNEHRSKVDEVDYINENLALLTLSENLGYSGNIRIAKLPSRYVAKNKILIASGLPDFHCGYNHYGQFYNGILSVTDSKKCPDLQAGEMCVETKGSIQHGQGEDFVVEGYEIRHSSPVMADDGTLVGFTKFTCGKYGAVQSIIPFVPEINATINGKATFRDSQQSQQISSRLRRSIRDKFNA